MFNSKRLWLLLAALVLAAVPARAQIGFLRGAQNTATSGGSASITVTITLNAGETAVVVIPVNHGLSSLSVSSVVDTGGSTYTQRANNSPTGNAVFIWTTTAGGALASTSVTVTLSSASNVVVCVGAYSNVTGFGVTGTGTGTSTTPSVAVTASANSWVIAGFVDSGSKATYSANVGNLRQSNIAGGGGPANWGGGALNDNAAPGGGGSTTNTATLSSSTAWNAVALELTGSAPTCPKTLLTMGVGC